MAVVAFPLPDTDFDVTEVAVPWKVLTRAGHEVRFATETGAPAACDPLLLTGVLFGQLGAEREARDFYAEMADSSPFRTPLRWEAIEAAEAGAIWFAGGHAPGMKRYLESETLQRAARQFFVSGRPVAAICHGALVLARAGVLDGRRTSCLPRYMELTAWGLTAWKLGSYYRTYPETVEDEVRRLGGQVETGAFTLLSRGTDADDRAAFVCEDGNYLSARWPGDSYLLAKRLLSRLPPVAALPAPT